VSRSILTLCINIRKNFIESKDLTLTLREERGEKRGILFLARRSLTLNFEG